MVTIAYMGELAYVYDLSKLKLFLVSELLIFNDPMLII